MSEQPESIEQRYQNITQHWLISCIRGKGPSRNTVAVGIVVLDHLRRECPVRKADVISPGGEIKGARSGLGSVLEKYGIPRSYLKEATTRQVHQDGQRLFDLFAYGAELAALPDPVRDKLLVELIISLKDKAHEWLIRQNLKLDIDRRQAPTAWIHLIVENAKSRSGGIVEQHLIGAKLEKRFKDKSIPNFPAHAADVQTAREGDFIISRIVYHVTASPGRSVIQKCAGNLRAGKIPILLVPESKEVNAKALAEDEGIGKELTVISIENFVALNIMEMAIDENRDYFSVLQDIVKIYNKRLGEVETDSSLQIDVR